MTDINDLEALVGKEIYVCCTSYAYGGKLAAIKGNLLVIEEPSIVYETGSWKDKEWRDAQRLPTSRVHVNLRQIESVFGVER